MKLRVRLLWYCLVLVVFPCSAWSAVIVVSPGESVQQALHSAAYGDDVVLLPGTYFETLTLIDGVNLQAQTPGTVFVDAEAEDSVVRAHQITNNTTVQGICFRNGSAEQGGGLRAVQSNPIFRDCVFESNGAALGGGASLTQGSAVWFDDCTFTHNTASVGGGLHLDFSAATINRSFFLENECTNDGAALAIQNGSEAWLEDICIFNNRARAGAIISVIYSSPTLKHCTITANQQDTAQGTVATHGSVARIELSIIAFNSGPAMQCTDSDFVWVGCNDIYGNSDDTICGADQGTNISADPLFCDPVLSVFNVQADSPVLGTPCGDMGAHISTCPAIITALESTSWSAVKLHFSN